MLFVDYGIPKLSNSFVDGCLIRSRAPWHGAEMSMTRSTIPTSPVWHYPSPWLWKGPANSYPLRHPAFWSSLSCIMGKPRDLYKTTKSIDNKRLPKPKKKSRPKGDGNNPWALLGAVAGLVAGWGFFALGLGRKSKSDRRGEQIALRSLLLKPMAFTDHGLCRMDCR